VEQAPGGAPPHCTGARGARVRVASVVCTWALSAGASDRAWGPKRACGLGAAVSPRRCPPEWLDGHITPPIGHRTQHSTAQATHEGSNSMLTLTSAQCYGSLPDCTVTAGT
jgi:hypothetical protein